MPKVSWSKATAAADAAATTVEEAQPETSTAVAIVPRGNMAAVPPRGPTGSDEEGEWNPSMNKSPYLSLFSNKSDGADETPEWIGTWVVDKQVSLGKEVVIIPVILKHWYEEVTEFGSGDIPDRWNTSAEANASGKEWTMVGEIQLLIEVPEAKLADEIVETLSIELAGKRYVPVKYTNRKTSWKEVYSKIRTDKTRWLKGAYPNGQYRLSIKKKTGQFTFLAPSLRNAGETPEDVRVAIRDEFGI